jgi:hypothetical protein
VAKNIIRAGAPLRESSDPMIDAGAPSTGVLQKSVRTVVRAPPGVVMVSPSEAPRNASEARAKSEGPRS